ncbi:DUF2946 family protein [Bradyrhizobium sp.]|uniref:DUF2946 family protein n=1 Tax=Bradyrhizobium sp. TaxID=376 RepID=UPI0025C54C56|nr:DUF2946 family protein [Bradyrhizobium sp.]
MRRRLELLIPIVLLAITVQLFAPIAAFRAFAYAVNDPLYMASICSDMGAATDDAQMAPARTQHHNGDCCAFCAGGHGGGTALQPPPLVFVTLQRQYQRLSWLEAADPMPAVRVGSNAQARAPPLSA